MLSNPEVMRFLDSLAGMKDFEIEISGGEPTCRKEIFSFMEYIKAKYPHVRCVFLTNGRNFSNISLAEKMAEIDPYSVIIPIHADTPELHDAITQSIGSFNETMQGIRNLYACGVNVGLKTILTRMNYKRMPQIVEMVAKTFFECPGITINGMDMQGKALINKDSIGIRLSEAIPWVEKAIDVADKYGLQIKTYTIPPCLLGEKYRKHVGIKFRSMVISKTPGMDMGRIELAYGTTEKCRDCKQFASCTGGWNSYFDVYGTEELKPI